MPSIPDDLLSYLRVVLGAWRNDPRGDDELLARFAQYSDGEAFKVLVCRYGLLVWRSCTRVLGEGPDAEDAFQAAFLALARKAGRLPIKNLAGWLHQVARQAALKSEAGVRRRRSLEQQLWAITQPEPEDSLGRTELYTALDEELANLPEKLRMPLLLHYLEGRSQVEVARLLGCPRSVVQYRLARAEAILREGLKRRGIEAGVLSIGALLGSTITAQAMPAHLIGSTARAALRCLPFPFESSTSAILAEGVMKTMLVTRMKIVAVLLGLTLCLAGGGLLTYQTLAGNTEEPSQPASEPRERAERPGRPGAAARVDCFGDPLPAGALARMGTTRLWRREGWNIENSVFAFSPDGKTLATPLIDGIRTVCLWDVTTGKEIRRLTTEAVKGSIDELGFSPDGKTLVAMDQKQEVCVWEVATGKLLRGKIGGIAVLSNNSRKLTRSEIRQFGCSKDANVIGFFSPDGKTLAVGDATGSIRLWEVTTGKEIGPRKGYRGPVRSVAYSPDGKTLVSGGGDGMVRLWDVATGKELRPLATKITREIDTVTYSPDGKMFVFVNNVIHLLDTATGKEIRQFKREIADDGKIMEDVPRSAVFSPDGKKLAAIMRDSGTVRLWEVATCKEIYSWSTMCGRFNESFVPLAFSPDGRLLAVPDGERECAVLLLDAMTTTGNLIGRLGSQLKHPGQLKDSEKRNRFTLWSLALSPDGRMLATSSWKNGKIRVWEVASGKEIWQMDGIKNSMAGWGCTLAFSPDSKILATAAQGHTGRGDIDPQVHLWEVTSGKEIGQLAGHQAPVQTIIFSPDGKTLASGSEDLTCLVWDLTPFRCRLKPMLPPPLAPQALSKEQLEAAWADLANDPAKFYAAIRTLQVVPTQAIALLQARVQPVASPADPQQLKRWIADLDAASFTVREKAQREIAELGELAIPALRQALKGQPVLEVKRRLKDLLAEIEGTVGIVPPRHLREFRAVQVLESIGTVEAREVLQALAKGASRASLTREAQAALARLAKHSAVRP